MSKQQSPKSNGPDFVKKFINMGRFPVYKYDQLKEVSNTDTMIVEKIPMFCDGVVIWTHYKITLKPSWRVDTTKTDVDIRVTILNGKAYVYIMHQGENGGDILESGDIFMIPAGATYSILNISKTEPCEYAMDANTMLEMG